MFLTEQLELITRWENGVGKVRHSHFPFWRLGIHSRGRRSERMKQTRHSLGPYRLETVSHNRAVIQPSFIYPWSGCVRPECKKRVRV